MSVFIIALRPRCKVMHASPFFGGIAAVFVAAARVIYEVAMLRDLTREVEAAFDVDHCDNANLAVRAAVLCAIMVGEYELQSALRRKSRRQRRASRPRKRDPPWAHSLRRKVLLSLPLSSPLIKPRRSPRHQTLVRRRSDWLLVTVTVLEDGSAEVGW